MIFILPLRPRLIFIHLYSSIAKDGDVPLAFRRTTKAADVGACARYTYSTEGLTLVTRADNKVVLAPGSASIRQHRTRVQPEVAQQAGAAAAHQSHHAAVAHQAPGAAAAPRSHAGHAASRPTLQFVVLHAAPQTALPSSALPAPPADALPISSAPVWSLAWSATQPSHGALPAPRPESRPHTTAAPLPAPLSSQALPDALPFPPAQPAAAPAAAQPAPLRPAAAQPASKSKRPRNKSPGAAASVEKLHDAETPPPSNSARRPPP